MTSLIFDKKALEEWQQIDPDHWQGMVGEILDIFLKCVNEKILSIEQAWRKENWKQVRECSHALKSSCGNVGAAQAHHLLHKIEATIYDGDVAQANTLLKMMRPILEESIQAIVDYRVALKSQAA